MDSDLDPFSDILPEPALGPARAGGKFQPKAKPRLKKIASTSVSSVLPLAAKVSVSPTTSDAAESIPSADTKDEQLKSPLSSSLSSSTTLAKEEHLENNCKNLKGRPENSSTQLVTRAEGVVISNSKNEDSSLPTNKKTDSSQPNLDSSTKTVSDASIKKTLFDPRATPSVQSVDVAKTVDPVVPLLPEQPIEINKPLEDGEGLFCGDNSNLESVKKELEPKNNEGSKDHKAEANGMGFDLDPFADLVPPPSISNVRVGGKFQPRAKARPLMGTSKAVAISSTTTVKEHARVASNVSDNLPPVNGGGSHLPDHAASSLTTLEGFVIEDPLGNNNCRSSKALSSEDDKTSGLQNASHLPSSNVLNSGITARDLHSGPEKSVGENADIFSELENFSGFVSQSPSCRGSSVPSSNNKEREGHSSFSAQDSNASSALRACNAEIQEPVSNNKEGIQKNDGRPELKEEGPFPIFERPDNFPESTIASGCHTRKFQQQLDVQSGKEMPASLAADLVNTTADPVNPEFGPSEPVYMDGEIPTFSSDDVVDYSSMSFNEFISPGPPISGFPIDEEQINLGEVSRSPDLNALHQEVIPVETTDEAILLLLNKVLQLVALIWFQLPTLFFLFFIFFQISWSRKRKSSEGVTDEDYDYRVDQDDDNEDTEENASPKKRASGKPGKTAEGKGKSVRKRKKDHDASEKSAQKPHKKFSHSTRRKNRLKDLLSMPEEEIDYQRLPVRDIILFAGYKERLAIKEAKVSKDASTSQSAVEPSCEENSHNEDDTVTSEQDVAYANEKSNSLFNYHSFMDKTPKSRWSKQDTELFYEAIQQFGTDLSMIQQLFPGRTRHQIKLKYKKEERQHPLRLSEALSNRAKDHSHFEKVIEQLQHVAAQAEQEANKEAAAATDEEAELNPETNEEMEKADENASVEDQNDDVVEDHHPSKHDEDGEDEDEDEMDIWSSYKSIF